MRPTPNRGSSPKSSSPGLLRRLRGDRRGLGAFEFALVGPVFMLFIGMIFDVGILLYQQAMLDNATLRASRFIRTGQVQLANNSSSLFTNQLCTDLSYIVDSCANIQYSVTSAASFSSLSTTVSSDGYGTLTGNGTFTPGTSGQDVEVRVAWKRPYIVPWVGNIVNPGGAALMVSVLAFRNELYN